jgi:hypothetical protein
MLHIFLLALTPPPSLAVASASLFVTSLLASTLLVNRYAPLQGVAAAQAMEYLEAIQSPAFKFQFVALVFSLPHTLNLWGTLAIFLNCIFMLATCYSTGFAAGVCVAAFLAFLAFQWTTCKRFNLAIAGLRAKFSRNQDALYMSMV